MRRTVAFSFRGDGYDTCTMCLCETCFILFIVDKRTARGFTFARRGQYNTITADIYLRVIFIGRPKKQ